jgi:hypothetical protein
VVSAKRAANGRITFNQVYYDHKPPPEIVVLVAVCPNEGFRVWWTPFPTIEPHATPQAAGYSHSLSFHVDNPPDYLREPDRIPREALDPEDEALFEQMVAGQTNTLHQLVKDLFDF